LEPVSPDLGLAELAAISAEPAPVVTRVVFTEADMRARRFVWRLCEEAGLELRHDAAGNTFARWQGSEPELPAVATGSHIDAIPNAGAYDGTVGVLGGLEAIRTLQRTGVRPRRSIELVLFTAEEPTRFGIGCLGSRILSGTLPASSDETLRDASGVTLKQARQDAGFTGELQDARLRPGCYSAFIELHIEQGPLLEQHGNDIGIVEAIAAPATLRVLLTGEGGHAGAVLMPQRRDAFLAAAEIALAVERAAFNTGAIDTVGTTGLCQVFPGAVNSIPSSVRMEIDIRDIDGQRRDSVLAQVKQSAGQVCERRGIGCEMDLLNADPPARCAPEIIDAVSAACDTHGLRSERMISRAYHDALFMSRVAPTAMIFIPCRGGVSHRPDEFSSPEAIARGVAALAATLERLAVRC
jgi:N-carbamoyl-L-amino-acid hydrolase